MGIAALQTYHGVNFSNDPQPADASKDSPDWPWIVNTVLGVLNLMYGFIGFWLAERRRLAWRVALHRIIP